MDDYKRMCKAHKCNRLALQGSEFCEVHIKMEAQKEEQAKQYMYRFEQAAERYGEFFDNPYIKSLKAEISILRLLLEKLINKFGSNENELLVAVPQISSLVSQINQLVMGCQKLEIQNNELLSKTQLMQFIDEAITAINSRVSDSGIVAEIVDELDASLNRIVGDGSSTS